MSVALFLRFRFFRGRGGGSALVCGEKKYSTCLPDECTATPCIDLGPFMIVHQAALSLALVVL